MKIPIVNQEDEVIEYKDRSERTATDICRITAGYIFNSKNEFLIAQRQFDKAIDPGKWGPSVAGTVEEGETYDSNIVKEVAEELGLFDINLTFFKKLYYEAYNGRRFTSVYIGYIDMSAEEFRIQKDEVVQVRWISIPTLIDWYTKKPDDFVPSFNRTIEIVKEYENKNKKT